MGSGKPKDNSGKYTQSAVSALNSKSYSDPYGSFKNGVFKPNLSATQTNNLSNIDWGINNAVNQLPTSLNVNDYYNNPFYQNTYNALNAALNQRWKQDLTGLNDDLNARGQLGSSFDAKQRNLLYQDYDSQYAQAGEAARQASTSAYQQVYQNALDKMNNLSGLKSDMMNQIYRPMQNYLNYQNAVTPLQQGQANAYLNLAAYSRAAAAGGKSATDRIGGAASGAMTGAQLGSFLGPIGTGVGAVLGGAAGAFM